METRLYKDMTWKELQEFVDSCNGHATIVIPIGCLEEHGPHLPLTTDGMLAMDFAAAAVQDESLQAIVGPIVDFGVSVLTQGFPGTVKVKFDTLRMLMENLMESCVAWGFTKIILWTWHGGRSHEMCLREASIAILGKFEGVDIFILPGVKLFEDDAFKQKIATVIESPGEHADELETSLMMYSHPELVRMDQLAKEYPRIPKYKVIAAGAPYMTHGVIGDATLATAEKGKALFEMILEEMISNVKMLLEQ
ncbi:MAG TPA: creatininase family protein [Candidatus Lokiarchaeia archaeon]|nr:creatininase family protein [Candidatus Lokiarchaeia archaeon]